MRRVLLLCCLLGLWLTACGCGGNEPIPTSDSTRPSRLPRPAGQ